MSPIFVRTLWQSLSLDIQLLIEDQISTNISRKPLWPEGTANILRFNRDDLLAQDPSFEIWLDWHNAIIDGKPVWNLPHDIAEKLEERIALGDGRGEGGQDFWDRPAAEVNNEIKDWVEEARAAAKLLTEIQIGVGANWTQVEARDWRE